MSYKSLTGLVLLLVVLGGGYYFLAEQNESAPVQETMFGNIADEISRVVIEKGSASVEAVVKDNQWVLPAKGNYMADTGKVNSFILRIVNLKSRQVITENQEKFKGLGVADESVGAGSTKVSLFDNTGRVLAVVILGSSRKGAAESEMAGYPSVGIGQYIRKVGDDKVYLISDAVAVKFEIDYWLKTLVANVLPTDVASIEQFGVDAQGVSRSEYKLARVKAVSPGEEEYEVVGENISGKKLNGETVSLLRTGLENLRLDDVFRAGDNLSSKLQFDAETVYKLANGLIYKIKSAANEGKTYITVSVEFGAPEVQEASSSVSGQSSASEVQSSASAQLAQDLSASYQGWVYRLPDYLGKKFRRGRDSLFQ